MLKQTTDAWHRFTHRTVERIAYLLLVKEIESGN